MRIGLEARLRRIEEWQKIKKGKEIYIFRVGNHDSCNIGSETELEKELKKPKYENAIVIRDLDYWIDE